MRFLAVFDGVDAGLAPVVVNGVVGLEPGDRIVNAINMTSGAPVSVAPAAPNLQAVVQLSGNLTGQRILLDVERP